MRTGRSILLKSLLVLLLCVATIIPVIANSDSKKNDAHLAGQAAQNQHLTVSSANEAISLAKSMLDGANVVKINDQMEMRLTQLMMMPDTNNQIVSFTLTITNDSAIDLNFIDYWIQLKTVNGTEYAIHYLADNADQDLIPAKTSKDFHFYAEVGADISYEDLIFELIAWDFNAPNYRKIIGSIKAPKAYTPLIEQGHTGVIQHANSRYHFRIDELYVRDPEDEEDENGEETKTHVSNIKEVELSLILENMSSRSTPLPNVSYSLLTDDGYIYLLQPTGASEGSLAPRIETSLTLGGIIPAEIDLATTNFLIFSNDHDVGLPLALYELPRPSDEIEDEEPESPEPPEIGLGDRFDIELERTNIQMSVDDYELVQQKEEKDETEEETDETEEAEEDKEIFYDATLSILFENAGRFSGMIPEYDYTIEFVETGDVFPLTVEHGGSIPLHPRMKHEQLLTVTLPEELAEQDVILIIRSLEPNESGEITYDQVASFVVPEGTIIVDEEKEPEEEPEEPEKEMQKFNVREVYSYETEQGTYFIYLEELQRYPWENEDILAAKLVVTNNSNETLPLPDIAGTFKLDNILLTDYVTNVVSSKKVFALMPGQSIDMMLYTKVPYSYNFTSSSLILAGLDNPPIAEEEEDQLEAIEDVEFINNRSLAEIEKIEVGESIVFDYISSSTKFSIHNLINIQKDDTQTVYIQAEMENLETREAGLPALKAYLRMKNNMYIPLNVHYEGALSPGGRALIVLSSNIANRYNIDDMDLIIGELTPEQDAYLNTVAVQLPESKTPESKHSTYDLEVYPYTLSFTNVVANMSLVDKIDFEYELSVEDRFEILPEAQNIVIEFVDDDAIFERTYQIGTDLKLGSHRFSFVIDIPPHEFVDLIDGFENYRINIYSEYEGYRVLLSTTNYTYF